MEQDAHLARFGRGPSIPLALRTFRTGTAVANAGRVDHPQAAIMLSTSFMRNQHLICWTPQRPIGLKRKVGAGEAARFPGRRGGGRSIARGRSGSGGEGWWCGLRQR